MGIKRHGLNNTCPSQQAVIRYSDALTQNQWYDLWDASAVAAGAGSVKHNVRLQTLSFDQRTAGEDIEIRIIADDLDVTISQTAVAGTNYCVIASADPDYADFTVATTDNGVYRAFLLEAKSLQVMYRKTTANGANAFLIKCWHALW